MAAPAIRIYDALKPALGELTTKEFMEALDESIVLKIEAMKNDLATKGDIDALTITTNGKIEALKDEITAFKLANKDEFAKLRSEMSKQHVQYLNKAYLIGLIQLILIIGALFGLIKSLR